jgi:hypothetical protein
MSDVVYASLSAARSPKSWRVLIVLSALMAFGAIATDMYLPALAHPGIACGAWNR